MGATLHAAATSAFALVVLLASAPLHAATDCGQPAAVCEQAVPGALALIDAGRPIEVLADSRDHPGVLRAARDLQSDLSAVSGTHAAYSTGKPSSRTAIIVGTLGRSPRIDRIVRGHGIDTRDVAGRWEGHLIQVVERPEPGLDRALLIVGADRRGTTFGIYELSRRLGVSPWTWWADVPVPRRTSMHVAPGRFADAPSVRYRGIFINDEDPALGGWIRATYGTPNHQFYERVFQLILRLKGNYLWPAMWGRAFADDDPRNPELADEYGIVIGTSHHEPMMRAHVEWERHGQGPWDYTRNAPALRQFWREGIERMGEHESLVTIGMRGDGDEPMTQDTAIELLEGIVSDQRDIIAGVTGKPAERTPQVWALYKEVQDYFDDGMKVPDDVMLLFADDNWGNIRRLPRPGDRRAGGYGVYYHFDYVGGPRNYKWLNTVQIERTWEQMQSAYAHGVDRLWIVNVGDIKPMEFPISFFLDHAWKPEEFTTDRLAAYPARWAAQQFGDAHAQEIGELLTRYTQYNARRKPELIDARTYSLDNFGEAARVETEWNDLVERTEAVKRDLPQQMHDAYFQLVEYPVLASANLNSMYIAQARNHRDAAAKLASANHWADEVQRRFDRDAELQRIYEQDVAGGKWPHMMSQVRIGYTGWQQPERNVLPATTRVAASGGRTAPASASADASTAPPCDPPVGATGFIECNGIVAIEAAHYVRQQAPDGLQWTTIPNLGRTLSGVVALPADAPAATPDQEGAWLEYPVWFEEDGEVEVRVIVSPSLDVRGGDGLRFGVSVGDAAPQVVRIGLDPTPGHPDFRPWEEAVRNSVHVAGSRHRVKAGAQTLKLWRIDPGVVFQRIEIARDGLPRSYLGPPESVRK
ncbi:glycosyl hydrolase 115 family protein [Lysobacter sp.]|uniref:glycosyl hydrolase 115 family protein n=1 Tax=Lysobacter sp. TaxID=72226 RepID=UPI0039C97667